MIARDIVREAESAYGADWEVGPEDIRVLSLVRYLRARYYDDPIPPGPLVVSPDGRSISVEDAEAFRLWWPSSEYPWIGGNRAYRQKWRAQVRTAWRAFRRGMPALPAWSHIRQPRSMRAYRALLRIVRKLGSRRASRLSRTGLTVFGPVLLTGVDGADLRRLSRLSRECLRWLAARETVLPRVPGTHRVDWAAMTSILAEWRRVVVARAELMEARVPMRRWIGLDMAATAGMDPTDKAALLAVALDIGG